MTHKDLINEKVDTTNNNDKLANLLPSKKLAFTVSVGLITLAATMALVGAVLVIGKIAPLTFKGITCAVAGTVAGYITVTKAMGEFNAEKIKESKVA